MTEADDVAEMAPAPVRPRRRGHRAGGGGGHPPTHSSRAVRLRGRSGGAFALLAKPYFRLEIHGREHVPTHGPFVLAPVHRSNLDFILVSALTRTRMRYMGKASIWKWRWGGKFVSMLGAFRCTGLRRPRGSADVSRGDRER